LVLPGPPLTQFFKAKQNYHFGVSPEVFKISLKFSAPIDFAPPLTYQSFPKAVAAFCEETQSALACY
jgi:hypothetical protein